MQRAMQRAVKSRSNARKMQRREDRVLYDRQRAAQPKREAQEKSVSRTAQRTEPVQADWVQPVSSVRPLRDDRPPSTTDAYDEEILTRCFYAQEMRRQYIQQEV